MNKLKRELIDESSKLSSSRWSLVTCIEWAVILSIVSISTYVICAIIGKPLPEGFLGGCAIIIGLIVGIPTTGKAVQSFSEYNNHYFDKYDEKEIKNENTFNDFEDDGK